MRLGWLRIALPLVLLAAAGIAYAVHAELGTLSAFGWDDLAVLCPIGAITTMLASRTATPRAAVSLVLAVLAIALLGRAFCGWVCPVPVWRKARKAFSRLRQRRGRAEQAADAKPQPDVSAPSNSRFIVLAGALLSAALFGFPVFCLICPIGLSFALVFGIAQLACGGMPSWTFLAAPVLILAETVLFRKWCSHICPISALMSLAGRLNRTWRPRVDRRRCAKGREGISCGRCSRACSWGLDPHLSQAATSHADCTRCRSCAESCPVQAIDFPFLARTDNSKEPPAPLSAPDAEILAALDRNGR